MVHCWSGGSLSHYAIAYLKNNFQIVEKNIEGTHTRSCTLFYPLCVCTVATGKHFDLVSQNSERIFILIKLNNNMMLNWFIMLRKIYWHLVGRKNYELIIIRLKQISVKPLKFVILHNLTWSEMGIFKVPLSWDFDEGDWFSCRQNGNRYSTCPWMR